MTESRPAPDAIDPADGSDVAAETVTESTEGAVSYTHLTLPTILRV